MSSVTKFEKTSNQRPVFLLHGGSGTHEGLVTGVEMADWKIGPTLWGPKTMGVHIRSEGLILKASSLIT
jgi:hypothetical protein